MKREEEKICSDNKSSDQGEPSDQRLALHHFLSARKNEIALLSTEADRSAIPESYESPK
jgi:hypothetical protein